MKLLVYGMILLLSTLLFSSFVFELSFRNNRTRFVPNTLVISPSNDAIFAGRDEKTPATSFNPAPQMNSSSSMDNSTDRYSLTIECNLDGYVALNNSGPYYYGDVVELTAVRRGNYEFAYWIIEDALVESNPTTILINGNKTVQAIFGIMYLPLIVGISSNLYGGWMVVDPVVTFTVTTKYADHCNLSYTITYYLYGCENSTLSPIFNGTSWIDETMAPQGNNYVGTIDTRGMPRDPIMGESGGPVTFVYYTITAYYYDDDSTATVSSYFALWYDP